MSSWVGVPNRMPAAPVVRVAKAWMDEEGEALTDGTSVPVTIETLALRADVKRDTLEKILTGRAQSIDFDLADRLLCAMHLTGLWLTDPELEACYTTTQFADDSHAPARASGLRPCARRGCSVMFEPSKYATKKKFCSPKCASADWSHRHRPPRTTLRGPGRALEKLVCRNGHERTPANTGFNGKAYFCVICKRNADTASRRRRTGAKPRNFKVPRTQVPA